MIYRGAQEAPEMGKPLMRYIKYNFFEELIETGEFAFLNPVHFVDTDSEEGRTTQAFKKVIERAVQIEGLDDEEKEIYKTEQNLANFYQDQFEIRRQHSYVSCWTMSELEDVEMWRSHANPGVIVKTTLGKLLDHFYEFQDKKGKIEHDADHFEITDRPVIYNREKMHTKLSLGNYQNFCDQIFYLDGHPEFSYRHEKEYRLVIMDNNGVYEDEEGLSYTEYGEGKRYVVEDVRRILKIPMKPKSFIDHVILSQTYYARGANLLDSKVKGIPYSRSSVF